MNKRYKTRDKREIKTPRQSGRGRDTPVKENRKIKTEG